MAEEIFVIFLKWYVDEEIDERLGLQKGTVVKYFANKRIIY